MCVSPPDSKVSVRSFLVFNVPFGIKNRQGDMACVQGPCRTKLPDAREVRADHSHVPADSWSDDVNHIVSDLATFPVPSQGRFSGLRQRSKLVSYSLEWNFVNGFSSCEHSSKCVRALEPTTRAFI